MRWISLNFARFVPMPGTMKAIFSIAAFFLFAVMFGVALVTTKWNERYEYEGADDDEN